MSTTGAAAPITITGLGSGLDTNSIIQQLVAAETTVQTQETAKETAVQQQITEWQNVNTQLLTVSTAATTLNEAATFTAAAAGSSDPTVATVSASAGAAAGNHTLVVNTLAQSQEVLSSGQSDATSSLGITGSFVLNGKVINVAATNSLTDVMKAINAAGTGVNAQLLTISQGNVKLSLTAASSGSINAISATDVNGGSALQQLGFLSDSGTPTIRQAITTANGSTGAGSTTFASSGIALGTYVSNSGSVAPSGTVQINGVNVALNLGTMSLTQVANAINQAGIPNVTAQIVGVPNSNGVVNSNSPQQLQLVSKTGAITNTSFTDSNGVLSSLGLVQNSYTSQISGATDATFSVDNVNFVRSSNTVSDVVPNVTMNLIKGGGSTTTVSVTNDTSPVVTAIQNLVQAYNAFNSEVNTENAYTPSSTTAGSGTQDSTPPLFGDYTLITIQQELAQQFTTATGGMSMADIGVTLGADGSLSVDTDKLTTALQNNPTQVYNLFGVSGTSNDANIAYSSAGSTTQSGTYGVNITQAATQASVSAGSAISGTTAQPETLSFTGSLFGTSSFNLTIPQGATTQDVLDMINNNSNLSLLLNASVNGSGDLTFTSKGFGSAQQFSVVSNIGAGGGGTGIGTTPLAAQGVDVQGTIGGEPATGVGQALTGKSTNANTAGLTIIASGATSGTYGPINVNIGLAGGLKSLVSQFTNSTGGLVTTAMQSLNQQMTDLQTQATQTQTELTNYQTFLQNEFANMESQVSELKNQAAAFTAASGSVATTSSAPVASTSSSTKSA